MILGMINPVYGGIAVSTLSWSFFDLSRKKLSVELNPIPVVAWLMLFQGFVFLGLTFLDVWQVPIGSYWIPFLASVALNALANVWFVESISLAPFSLAIPILSLTPVFSSMGGLLVLQESLSLRQATGIAVVVGATLAIGYFGTTSLKESEVTNPRAVRKGLFLMALVALLFALTPVVDKLCLQSMPSSEHGMLQCFATWACLAGWLAVRGGHVPFSRIRANLVWFLAAVVFVSIAVYFQFWSIKSISVGVFEALKRSGNLITALVLGYFVFKEAFTISKLLLVCVMGAGIFILLT
jgi:drug/metabolite transporter (DMT)-like permease